MKKIILPLLILVIFASCERVKSVGESGVGLEDQKIETDKQTNETVINGENQIQLAVPTTPKGLQPYTNPDKSHYWYYQYAPSTDVNGNPVNDVVIHVEYQKVATADCPDEFEAKPFTCSEGQIYKEKIKVPIGHFCVKAIACLDGYIPSNVSIRIISPSSGFEGDKLIFL